MSLFSLVIDPSIQWNSSNKYILSPQETMAKRMSSLPSWNSQFNERDTYIITLEGKTAYSIMHRKSIKWGQNGDSQWDLDIREKVLPYDAYTEAWRMR